MTFEYTDLIGYVKIMEATRIDPPEYDEVECEYSYDVDDEDVKGVLSELVDEDKRKPGFDDYESLDRYVDDNFDELCEEYRDELMEHYRDNAQDEFERCGGYVPPEPEYDEKYWEDIQG